MKIIRALCRTSAAPCRPEHRGSPAQQSPLAQHSHSAHPARPARLVVLVAALWLALAISWQAALGAEAAKVAAASAAISDKGVEQHVTALADDIFEGREGGTRGGRAAAVYIVEQLRKIDSWQPAGDLAPDTNMPSYFQEFGRYRNILAMLPGSDPQLRDQVVLVGAHYDHVGYGTPRNSYGPTGFIHNGADDNASGCAGLIEVMRAIQATGIQPRRTLLFAFWDAEEKGLLGSKHWVENPTMPLDRVVAAINIDMIGRVRNERLIIFGSRTISGARQLLSDLNVDQSLLLDFDWDMRADSDHHTFYDKQIPVLMLHSGLHENYHRPSDDVERINFPGLRDASRYLLRLTLALADQDELPDFRIASQTESQRARQLLEQPLEQPAGRLGLSWREEPIGAGADQRALIVTRVVSGSAAEQAGVQIGDRLLAFNSHEITNGSDLRHAVLLAPNATGLRVRRRDAIEPADLPVNLSGNPVRLGISWRGDLGEPRSVVLVRVIIDSPAHRAGLQVGDRIEAVNGQPFHGTDEFVELLRQSEARPGPIEVLIERQGRKQLLRVG